MLNIIGVNPVGSTGNYALPTLLVASTIPIVDGNGVLAPASALTPSVVDPDPVCGPENDSGCCEFLSPGTTEFSLTMWDTQRKLPVCRL